MPDEQLRFVARRWIWLVLFLWLLAIPALAQEATTPVSDDDGQPAERSLSPDDEAVDSFSSEPVDSIWRSRQEWARNIEWLGLAMGWTLHFRRHTETGETRTIETKLHPFPRLDLRLFTLHLPQFYVTLLELHPVYYAGATGVGMRLGARVKLRDDYRHELRLGGFIGTDYLFYTQEIHYWHLSVEPHIEYRYNTEFGSVGAGLTVSLLRHFDNEFSLDDGGGHYMPQLSAGVGLYITCSVGRGNFER